MAFCVSQTLPDNEPDISPQGEEICALLTDAGLEQTLIDTIMALVSQLELEAIPQECAKCMEDAARREATEPDGWLQVLPETEGCMHGIAFTDCNPCMIAADIAADAARERAVFGRR